MSDEDKQQKDLQDQRDKEVEDAQEAAKERWGDDAQPSTDSTIHYADVPAGAPGTPTAGPEAIERGTESDEAREAREARAEAEEAEEAEKEKGPKASGVKEDRQRQAGQQQAKG